VGGTLDEDNQSLLEIDPNSNQFCLAGLVQGTDAGPLPGRRVSFSYQSNGGIKKQSPKVVTGDFSQVALTLTIEDLNPARADCGEPNPDPQDDDGDGVVEPGEQNCEFERTVTSDCRLKGKLQKAGTRSKARVRCDLRDDLAAFELHLPANREFLENVEAAFPKAEQKHVKINTSKGRIRITHDGEPDPGGLVKLSCGAPG
jgi:hypothetical protein